MPVTSYKKPRRNTFEGPFFLARKREKRTRRGWLFLGAFGGDQKERKKAWLSLKSVLTRADHLKKKRGWRSGFGILKGEVCRETKEKEESLCELPLLG